jgi:cytoskeletal protein CcmA (bactofilin family)
VLLIDSTFDGSRVLQGEVDFRGTITGTASIAPGATIELRGTVGALVVGLGAKVILYGTVTGDAHNQGGTLIVVGTINGDLHQEAGATTVHPDAQVQGRWL